MREEPRAVSHRTCSRLLRPSHTGKRTGEQTSEAGYRPSLERTGEQTSEARYRPSLERTGEQTFEAGYRPSLESYWRRSITVFEYDPARTQGPPSDTLYR